MFDTWETIRELSSIPGVSGAEGAVARRIAELAAPHADEVTTDTLGNLIVRKKGPGKRVMLSAHMDTIGVAVTHIDEQGFVRFAPIGGLGPLNVVGCQVVFANGRRGVVSCDAKVETKALKLEHCFIDIGASGREEASALVGVGDRASYVGESFVADGRLVSPYLDDRIGCVALLQTLARIKEPINDLHFVFSVQEEVGLRGARTAAFGIAPDWALAVDVTGAGDTPDPKFAGGPRLGGGVCVKVMNRSLLCHPAAVCLLEETARAEQIPYQLEAAQAGGTDAGAIQLSRTGVVAGSVGIPTRYVHSAAEMADLKDIEACVALLTAVLRLPPPA